MYYLDRTYPASKFWENGFCIVRSVFTSGEVADWRRRGEQHADQDMFTEERLRELILSDRALKIARTILGSQDLLYFGDSSTMVGKTDAGFHKDNVDKDDAGSPDWRSRYAIIRFGLYTDDYAKYSGGIDFRVGSHNFASVTVGKHVSARPRPGDLVIWNLRTSHSGEAMLTRSGAPINPATVFGKIARRMPHGLITAPTHGTRVALFWTYAIQGAHLERYIAYLKTRRYAVERWEQSRYQDAWLAQAAAAGVEVLNVRSKMTLCPADALNDHHLPLPY